MSKTSKTGGGSQSGGTSKATTTTGKSQTTKADEAKVKASAAADTAKDKVVKPETESAIKDAAAAVTGTAKHAGGVAKDQAESAKATAQEAIGTAKDEARTQADNIKGQAKARADEARAKAGEMSDEAKRRAREEAENRKRQATGAMSTTASDLRKASEAVEENWMSRAFMTAASQVEDVTRSIENKSPEELTQVARQAARNNPGLFLAGCFAAGVAISRTLKVAAARQPEHYYDDDGQRRPGRLSGASGGTYQSLGTTTGGTSGASGMSGSDDDLPNVGGHSDPDGQVGIGSGTQVTEGLGTSSDTTNR